MKKGNNKGWMIFLFFVFFIGCAAVVIPNAAGAAEVGRQEFYVTTDTGMKLMVVVKTPASGRLGKAILLVHGSGVGWVYWDIPIRNYGIMEDLAKKGLDVYAVECRGYGKSTKPNGMEVNATTMASDLKSVLKEIIKRSGVSKVSMAGHSSAGSVLLVAAGTYPEMVDRMVLIGAPYKKIHPNFVTYATKVIEMGKEPGKDYVPNLHYKEVEKRLDAYDDDVVAWYKKIVEEQYGLMPAGVYPDVIKNPGIPIVSTTKVPTLILNGSNEYVVDPQDALDLFKDLGSPDKAMIILPGGYHLMFIEKRGSAGLQETLFFWFTKK
jgi:alpha-beta hydrolase superfamily lysophospholipase